MKNYVQVFQELKNESGRIAKENILRKYEDIPGLKKVLQFAFNPMIVTGMAYRKIDKETNAKHSIELETIFDAMTFVQDNNTGNDIVIATIQNFLSKLESPEEIQLAKQILVKDMPYGLSRVTLNKVYGNGFIEKYGVQLAGGFNTATEKTITGEFAVTLKLDGNRVTFFNFEEGLKAFTRSGKEVEGLEDLEKAFSYLPKNMVYDGEILALNPNNIPSKELFNATQTIVRRKGIKNGLSFVMFDLLPINEFNQGKSKLTYVDRMKTMKELFDHTNESNLIVQVPTYYVGNDKSIIPQLLDQVEKQGFEGLMLNTLDGHYQTKRTKELLKIKTFHTADLRVLEVKEEVRGGKCGALVVDYKGYKVSVAVLSHKEQKLFWENQQDIIGKLIEVKYFEESTNAQKTLSLRFPSFVSVRDDKNEVSYV